MKKERWKINFSPIHHNSESYEIKHGTLKKYYEIVEVENRDELLRYMAKEYKEVRRVIDGSFYIVNPVDSIERIN